MKTPTEIARERFAGKRVTVVGLAREGISLVRFLMEAGGEVIANDRAPASILGAALASLRSLPVRFELGGHPPDVFLQSDVVFVSPGVPQEMEPLAEARRRGIPVSSETQLFFELCQGRIVGITGSAGKTTTTALTGNILREAGFDVHVGGNIGVPLLERLDEIGPEAWVVLEMSSFQLETLPCSPPIAAILNLSPNHLDRHRDIESYVAAKANIVRHQRPGDRAILNRDDPVVAGMTTANPPTWFSMEAPVEGGYVVGGQIVVRRGQSAEVVADVADVRLRGRHNLANVVAAATIASAAGAPPAAVRPAIRRFRGVPHRLEIVGVVDGITFCNDSIATAPERSVASLRSFDEPIVLLAGGRSKQLPLQGWARLIRERVKVLVLMGESAGEIERAVLDAEGPPPPRVLRAGSMEEAVDLARAAADPGDMVLLAPGYTSFDLFRDFEERGECFRARVISLSGNRR